MNVPKTFFTARRRARGSVFLMTLILVAIVAAGAAGVWEYLQLTFRENQRAEIQETTFCLAEAGLDKAVALLKKQPEYAGEQHTPLGTGSFSVEVTRDNAPGQYRLKSVAMLGEVNRVQGQCTLTAIVRLAPGGEVSQYQYHVEPRGQ